jgi:hypothetical protein
MTDTKMNDAKLLASHAGLKLIEMNDARGGRFRVQRGRDILHAADDLEDVQGFIVAWMEHVR